MTRRAIAAWAVTTLVIAGLVAVLVLQILSVRHRDARVDRRTAAVAAAKKEVVALLTVSAKTSTADIRELLDNATADFHDQLEKRATSFQSALRSGKVTSTGSIAAAGLVSLDGPSARVAIAARATVTGTAPSDPASPSASGSPSPSASPSASASASASSAASDRSYRLTVDVRSVGGRWLVSGLTFVV